MRERTAVKKAEVLRLLQTMPEEIDAEDLMYRLYVMQKIEEGEEAIRSGDVVTHEEMIKISDEWLK